MNRIGPRQRCGGRMYWIYLVNNCCINDQIILSHPLNFPYRLTFGDFCEMSTRRMKSCTFFLMKANVGMLRLDVNLASTIPAFVIAIVIGGMFVC